QPEDTKAYIQYRLQQAGADNSIIHDNCYPFIHQQSKGIPRKINTLMDRVLLYGYLEDKKQLNTDDVQLVITEINQEVANLHTAEPAQSTPTVDNAGISNNVAATLNTMIEEKLKLLLEM